jgi:predicted MFS family arabinose efflux permease
LAAFTLTRTVINTGYRMVYPFLPAIARGLGVNLQVAALAVTARSSLGLLGPVLGSSADSRGRKVSMLAGLGLLASGLLLIGVWPTVPALFIGMLFVGAGKIMFDSAMYAYVGDRVVYQQRGLAIALVEFGWSGAFLLGIPVAGWLIARGGWSSPFPWIALASLACGTLLWRILPNDLVRAGPRALLGAGLRSILDHPSAVAGLAVGFLASAANESMNVVYGAWMEQSFGLPIAAIGAASAIIGVSELGGEGLVAGFADRLGKRRAVMLGALASALSCLSLPILGRTLPGALAGLFFFYITFEFTLVSSIPLMTEQLPDSRATLLSGNIAALSGGRVVGALIGPPLFVLGMGAVGSISAGFNLLALAALVFVVRERAVEGA